MENNPIPPNPFPDYPHIRFLSRITIQIDDPAALTSNITTPAKNFDLIAALPTTEKALQWLGSNTTSDFDILSLETNQRLPFPPRHNLFTNLIARGIAIEICYAAGVADSAARRNIISNATGIVRGTRGRGLLISSGAGRAADLRGPFDVINFAWFWGVKQEVGMGDGGKVLLHSRARRETYRGAVQIVSRDIREKEKVQEEKGKRKVVNVDLDADVGDDAPKKMVRKKRKRR